MLQNRTVPFVTNTSARNVLLQHSWPGNVREFLDALRRAAIRPNGATIDAENVREALLPAPRDSGKEVLESALGDRSSLPDLLANVACHYLTCATERAAGDKFRAAELVGFASYQTLTNWLSKYGVGR